jgi:hypothetical protein
MSGYRDRSSFDPYAGDELMPAPPTWVQRIGITCLFVGAAVTFAYLAGQWGLIPKWVRSPMFGTMFVIIAGPLIGAGARRGPLGPDAKRKRLLIIAGAVAVCALAAVTIFYSKGA